MELNNDIVTKLVSDFWLDAKKKVPAFNYFLLQWHNANKDWTITCTFYGDYIGIMYRNCLQYELAWKSFRLKYTDIKDRPKPQRRK